MELVFGDTETYDLAPHIAKALPAMAESQKVFVHCSAGASRSASIVIAYCMKTKGWQFNEALAYVQERRPCVDPNAGFRK